MVVPVGWHVVETWWNGSWGRMNQRRLWLYVSDAGDMWRVEARQGDADAKVWSRDFVSELDARQLLATMRDRSGTSWRQLS